MAIYKGNIRLKNGLFNKLVAVNNNNSVSFTQLGNLSGRTYSLNNSLTSLTIDNLIRQRDDEMPIWDLEFRTGATFTFSQLFGDRLIFANGTPTWKPNTRYVMLIQEIGNNRFTAYSMEFMS